MIRRWKDEEFEEGFISFSTKLIDDDYGQFVLFYDYEKEIENKNELLKEMAQILQEMLPPYHNKRRELMEAVLTKYHEQINKNKEIIVDGGNLDSADIEQRHGRANRQ